MLSARPTRVHEDPPTRQRCPQALLSWRADHYRVHQGGRLPASAASFRLTTTEIRGQTGGAIRSALPT
jgi:hypothetical protein